MLCPLCKIDELEIRESQSEQQILCCSNWKPAKNESGEWINNGNCNFRINFRNKVFGDLTLDNIKSIMGGSKVTNKKGDTIELDLQSEFFTKITFAETKVTKFDL